MKIIKFNQLYHNYQQKASLININLTFQRGKRYLLIGEKDSGKSSIFKMIKGHITRRRGSIRIDGKLYKPPTQRDLAYLAQNTYLYANVSVLRLIYYYDEYYSDFHKNKARKLLQVLNIKENKNINNLTPEEKEIILFILTMCRKADFYLIDNPLSTSTVDKKEFIITTVLNTMPKSSCIIISMNSNIKISTTFHILILMSKGHILSSFDIKNINEHTTSEVIANYQ